MTDISLSQTLVFGHIWQSVAIAAVLAGALILGKRMRGSTRYGLGLAAFAASLVLPLAAFIPGETIVVSLLKQLNAPVSIEQPLLSQTIAGPSVAVVPASPVSPAPSVAGALFPVNYVAAPSAPAAPAVKAAPPAVHEALFTLPALPLPDIGLPLLFTWLGVAGFLMARTVRDLVAVERLVARARPANLPETLKARMNGVRIVVSADAPGPMAAGLIHPAIVLPESIALASPGMAALLEHEYAHIRRRDMLAALGQRVVLALLWWSPALYWISRRMDEEREVACDEAAVDRTGDAKAFARSLTTQAENQLWVRAPRLAVGAIGPRSQFGRRIRRLIDMAKTGGAPAKYSGRLAFAGLAVAIGVAAMVTPRFTADAQPESKQGAIDLTKQNQDKSADIARGDGKLDGAAPGSHDDIDFQWDGKDFAGLGQEIESMLAELQPELEALGAEFGPQMQSELQDLSNELAGLGVDISSMVNEEVLTRMPQIMEEVHRSLEAAGHDMETSQEWKNLSEEQKQEARDELRRARDEMKRAFGPEMRDEIRRAMAEAREELASHREEIAAAMREGNAGMAEARAAIAAARAEIDAARARGDFKKLDGIKFDFEHDVMDQLRKAGIDLDGAKGMKIAMHRDGKTDRLIDAADDCDVAELNKLIMDEKADVNAMIPGQGSALMAAAEANCVDAARALINAGADVNHGFPGQGTPLSIAASNSSESVVDLLLSRGANANAGVPGQDLPLVEAVKDGNLGIVKSLVSKGADVNLRTPMTGMRTPLDIALSHDEEEIADYLKSKGAKASRDNH